MLLVIGSLGAAAGATLQERLANAVVLRQFNTEGARVWQVVTAKDRVGFILHRKDSSLAVVYDLDGVQRFRFGIPEGLGEYRQLQGLTLSEDGSTVVVEELVDIEYFHSHVFGTDEKELFWIGTEWGLLPSPGGKHFCRAVSWSTAALDIYDAEGKRTGGLPPPNSLGYWNCRFVDDDRLLVADGETVKLIDARATTVWIVSLGPQRDPGVPVILPSPTRRLVVVYDDSYLLVLTFDGQELWRASYTAPEYLCAVAIDEATAQMALQLRTDQRGHTRVVALHSGAPLSAPTSLDRSTIMTLGSTDHVRLSDGLLSILGPTNYPLRGLAEASNYWTLFIQLDDSARAFSARAVIPGLYFEFSNGRHSRHYLRVGTDAPVALLRVGR